MSSCLMATYSEVNYEYGPGFTSSVLEVLR